MNQKRPLIILTGASAGLGLVLAKMLIEKDCYNLVLTSRKKSLHRFEKENIFESENIHIKALDVTSKEEREKVIFDCEQLYGGLDILINNAGVAMRSVAEDATAEERIEVLEVNYIGPMRLIALALPGMRKRRNGKIINISSAAGLVGMPTMASYCGSKFALEGATESLWYEVKPWNIDVSLIIPGFINSDSFKNTITTEKGLAAIHSRGKSPYYLHYVNMEKLISWTVRNTYATPDSVSLKILKIIECNNPPLRVPVTIDAWFLYLFRRFLPRSIYHWMVYAALPKSNKWGKNSLSTKTQNKAS